MKPSRFETLKKKYTSYKSIYEKNKRYEDFANWFFEKSLLGFSYSKNLSDCFGPNKNFRNSIHFNSCETGDQAKYIGVIEDVIARKSKKNNQYVKMTIGDEYGRYDALLLDGRDKNLSKFLSKNRTPEKNNIIILLGSKGDDILFVNQASIIDEKIYMKLSDIK